MWKWYQSRSELVPQAYPTIWVRKYNPTMYREGRGWQYFMKSTLVRVWLPFLPAGRQPTGLPMHGIWLTAPAFCGIRSSLSLKSQTQFLFIWGLRTKMTSCLPCLPPTGRMAGTWLWRMPTLWKDPHHSLIGLPTTLALTLEAGLSFPFCYLP